jgi:protein phosphatase methylesterase 1
MPANEPIDLTLDVLAADLMFVVQSTKAQMRWPELPPMVMVGHSLGGAVVTQAANTATAATLATASSAPLGTSLLGYVVLDVVEGSAMDALQTMMTYLSTRPSGFTSVQSGIDWHVRSRTIRNSTSARTSVPSLLAHSEENGGLGDGATSRPWRWRTDLAATQPFWEGWFVGLSKKFLSGRGGKMLLLAGTDRLDTELTIGQMQGKLTVPSKHGYHSDTDPGKYALQVFPEAGHFIHEDMPEKTAVSVVDFYRRNDRTALVLPPKVADLLKQGKKI